jgi:hypothetical protein
MIPFQFSYGPNNFLYEEDAYIGEQDIPLDSAFGTSFHHVKPQVMQHTIQLAPDMFQPRTENFTLFQFDNCKCQPFEDLTFLSI